MSTFAERIADYVATHDRYEEMTKREVVLETVRLLTSDISAAQGLLDVIGVRHDLYGAM